MRHTINTADAICWIAFATKTDTKQVFNLDMSDKAVRWIGHHLSRNKLLNPPRDIPTKTLTGICVTCKQGFIATYRTKKPIHCHAHQR